MSSGSKLITIGITCFNAEQTIERAIESACSQDWGNFEIIIVDDCSTDNSVSIIKNIQTKNQRIHLYHHENNRGYPSSLNTIIKYAQGDYIAFFDDDDNNETDRITKQHHKISSFESAYPNTPVLCYSHRRVFVDGVEKPEAFVHAIGAKVPEPYGSMVADFLLWHKKVNGYTWGEFGSCTMMAPTKTLKNFGFDTKFRRCAEWDLAVRTALQGGCFIAVDEPLVIQHKTNTPDKAGKKPLYYALMLRRKHKKYLRQHKVYWGAIAQAFSRFYYFRNRKWMSRLYLFLACLLSPTKILIEEIKKRTGQNNTIV